MGRSRKIGCSGWTLRDFEARYTKLHRASTRGFGATEIGEQMGIDEVVCAAIDKAARGDVTGSRCGCDSCMKAKLAMLDRMIVRYGADTLLADLVEKIDEEERDRQQERSEKEVEHEVTSSSPGGGNAKRSASATSSPKSDKGARGSNGAEAGSAEQGDSADNSAGRGTALTPAPGQDASRSDGRASGDGRVSDRNEGTGASSGGNDRKSSSTGSGSRSSRPATGDDNTGAGLSEQQLRETMEELFGKKCGETGNASGRAPMSNDSAYASSNFGSNQQAKSSDRGSGRLAKRSHGGVTTADETVKQMLAREKRRPVVQRVLRALRDVIDGSLGSEPDEPSERVSGRKLVRELASKRCNVTQTHKLEIEMPAVVVAADVSGSCSACANETWSACLALAQADDRVLAVKHSNGYVVEVIGLRASETPPFDARGAVQWTSWWKTVVGRLDVKVAVVFGDMDAVDTMYRPIVDGGAALFWLDSFESEDGRTVVKEGDSPLDAGNVRYFTGVGNAKDSLTALIMCRRARARKRGRR